MNLTYEIIRNTTAFAELRAEWNALLRASGAGSPFLTWEWMSAWWRHYCERDASRRLAIVVARRENDIVAILPGYVHRPRLGLATFGFLGTEYESSDYLQVIEQPVPGSASALAGMLDVLLTEERGLDVLHLSNILSSPSTLGDLAQYASTTGVSHEVRVFKTCPFVPTVGDWESYVAQLSAKMRKNVRRSTRQLVDGGAGFILVADRAQVRPGIAELFDLHARRFVTKNEKTGFRADLRGPFHADVAEQLFDAGILRLFQLRVAGKTVAALYCFEFADTLFFFQSGIDPDSEKLSAGTVLVGHAIKYAFDHGLACFDFMRGEEAYKFRWTDKTRQMFAVRLGVSLRGRVGLAMQGQGAQVKGLLKRVAAARVPAPAPTAEADAS